MAEYKTYRCEHCGYEVDSNPAGFDGLMSGLVIDFKCSHCKEIVDVLMERNMYWVNCPKCGKEVTSTWNPIDGRCPKCDGEMLPVPGTTYLAD